nr:biotin/lipoyl-binding protein [uncultured Cellulosilyticum sp.]
MISIAMLLTVGCANEEKQEVSNVSYIEEVDDSIEVSGKIKANKIREVSIDFPATVEEIYVLEGDKLEKGQEILALNYEEYKDEIKQKEQDLELKN